MRHCYLFEEGYKKEIKWEEYISCRTFVQIELKGNQEGIPKIAGYKNYWILFPKESHYFVCDSSNVDDIGKTWDFDNHCCT